jgi:integrase
MGTVFRPTYTKPLPTGAEVFARKGERFARWKDGKGRARTAPLTTGEDGSDRLTIESDTFVAKYRDGSGLVKTVSTGCRDETAARSVLTELERRAVRVKSGLLTHAEDTAANHQAYPIAEHTAAYLTHLEAKGTTPEHRRNVEGQLDRVIGDCKFTLLSALNRSALERWLVTRGSEGMGARTRNTYLAAIRGFANWAVRDGRLVANPFTGIAQADEKADPRRQRRALAEAELVRLLEAAQHRPLADALTIRRGKRVGQKVAKVSTTERERLEALGRERALIYKTLVLTGLRKGELASLTVGAVDLDATAPYLNLAAADEKARRGADIPIRADLAADLRAWMNTKLETFRAGCCDRGESVPLRLPPSTPLFDIPADLWKILDRPRRRRHRQDRGDERREEDRQARRARPHHRRACPQAHLRHTPEQGQRRPADGPGRDAPWRHRVDDGRVHRSEAARRGRGPQRPARAAAPARRRPPAGYRNPGRSAFPGTSRGEPACTTACTNS